MPLAKLKSYFTLFILTYIFLSDYCMAILSKCASNSKEGGRL